MIPSPAELSPVALGASSSGNRCGHQPCAPRLEIQPPTWHRARPSILQQASMRIERWYTQPKASEFASLALGLKRQRRSELRESVVSITRALLHFLDLATLRVAAFDYANDRACALQIRYLAGIAQLSESRAQRALIHLRVNRPGFRGGSRL